MQVSEKAGRAGGPGTPDAVAAPIVRALQSVYRAYQRTAIYPPGHPAISEALGQAVEGLELALALKPRVVIGVAPDHLLADHARLSETEGVLRSLASVLHELDLAAVGLEAGLEPGELEVFVRIVGHARTTGKKGAGIKQALASEGVTHVKVCPIDYDALQFGQGTVDENGDRAEDSWETLTKILTDASYLDQGPSPEDLAERASRRIARQEGTGAAELRKRVHRMVQQMDGMDADRRREVRQGLVDFVTALSPGLRQDLLRVDPYAPDLSLRVLHELADDLPAPELLEALQEIDRVAGRAPDELLILMNKLVRLGHERPDLGPRLRETLEGWGIPAEALSADSLDMRSALEEMFQRRGRAEFNPADYQSLLEELSRRSLDGAATPSAALYRNPADPLDVRLHSAELAALLLGRPDGEEHRTGLFAYVGSQVDMLLDHARLTTLHEAANAARTANLIAAAAEETRRAAGRFLEEFRSPSRIEKILCMVRDGRSPADDAIPLLRLGGEIALDRAVDLLASDPPQPLAEAIHGFVLEGGPESLARTVDRRAHRTWSATKPIFSILSRLPRDRAVPLLERLLGHDEFGVRRDALHGLCDLEDGRGNAERYLKAALEDPDQRVVIAAIKRLAERERHESLELFGRYLEGRLSCGRPAAEHAGRVARMLMDSGDAGRACLCRTASVLSRKVGPGQARLARGLVELVRTQGRTPEVRDVLRRWRWSPARVVSLFTTRIDLRDGEARA